MGNLHLLNKIMIFDVYLRQLVTLAIKSKREKPRGWKKPKEPALIHDIGKHMQFKATGMAVTEMVGEKLLEIASTPRHKKQPSG